MKDINFDEAISRIVKEDIRYPRDAYLFIRDALGYAAEILKKPQSGTARHLSAQELLEGIRLYALEQYGPLAQTVLNHWGVYSTEDFGSLVFNLVRKGVLGKSGDDRIEDFADGYDFAEVFAKPYFPAALTNARAKKV